MLERERLGQERIEADRLADLEQLRVEQERHRTNQDGIEAERLADLERRVEGERVEAETEEFERETVLGRLDAAMARRQEADHEWQEEECFVAPARAIDNQKVKR